MRPPITPRQLAGHLAGIRHYAPAEFLRPPTRCERLADGLAIFGDDPLLHAPGERYTYSSYGYNLLGLAIEGASGRDFLHAVDELVLRPLGLRDTVADDGPRIVERRTRFYARDGAGHLRNERPVAAASGRRGAFSRPPTDLVRFGSAHLRDGFFKPETRRLLFTPQITTSGRETGVGLGWRVGTDAAGRRFLHHGGTIEGGRAFLLMYPDAGVVVAILTNLSAARFAEAEAQGLAVLFMR